MIGQHLREGDLLARRYLLAERIGAGGMSVIWRAWDEALQRTVAVKVLDGPIGTDDGHRDRIRREARAAARIEHPHAIQVYDYGETVTPRGRIAAYVVMQLLDGASLADRLAAGPLDWPEAVAVTATVADVLAAAHRRGVVHRDVTPENVMLTTDGVKLLDFGIATEFGQREETITFGTPPYVAPERLAGGQATGATDVYALGVLLYESLTGTTPFGATTWAELEVASREVPPIEVPGLPPGVAAICRRCLAVDPAERPRAEEVAAALNRAAAPGRRARRWLLPVAALLAIVAVVTLVLANRDHGTLGAPTGASSPTLLPSPGAPSASANANAGRASSAPASSPTRAAPSSPAPTASPTPTPLSPDAAANAVFAVLDRRTSTGDVRLDVANDVRNQVNDLIAHPVNPQPRIDNLRRQLKDRQREQSISADGFAELDARIVDLGNALAAA